MLAGLTNCTADLVPGDQHGSSSQQPRIDDVVDVTSVYCRSEKLYRGDGAVMRAAAVAGSVEGGLVDGRDQPTDIRVYMLDFTDTAELLSETLVNDAVDRRIDTAAARHILPTATVTPR